MALRTDTSEPRPARPVTGQVAPRDPPRDAERSPGGGGPGVSGTAAGPADAVVQNGTPTAPDRAAAPHPATRQALALPAALVREVGAQALGRHAKPDGSLRASELDRALEDVTHALTAAGAAPAEAQKLAKEVLLESLGLYGDGTTRHTLDPTDAVQLAYRFGSPLAHHEHNLADHLRTSLFVDARAVLVTMAQELGPERAGAAQRLGRAESFAQLVEILGTEGLVDSAVAALASGTAEQYRDLYTTIVGERREARVASLTSLDELNVAVTDVDGDGRLSKRDLVAFQLRQGGLIAVVNDSLRGQLEVAGATQAVVPRITNEEGSSRFRFVLFPPEVNPAYFSTTSPTGQRTDFHLLPGASASAALDDLVQNAERYGFECNSAIQVVWHLSQLHIYRERYGADGDARFDRDFAGMTIGPDATTLLNLTNVQLAAETNAPIPGDHLYYKNPAVDALGRANGWQGENVVYLGRDERGVQRYYGHPFGITSEKTILEHLAAETHRIDLATATHNVEVIDRETRALLAAAVREKLDPAAQELARDLGARLSLIAKLRAQVREVERTGAEAMTAVRAYEDALSSVGRGEPSMSLDRLAELRVTATQLDRVYDEAGDRVLELVQELEASLARNDEGTGSLRAALHKIRAQSPGLDRDGVRFVPRAGDA